MPSVTRTEFRRAVEQAREAASLPLDQASRKALEDIHRRMQELHHAALDHPVNPATGRRECPNRICLHEYQEQPDRMRKTAELAVQAAELLDRAGFRYRWNGQGGPEFPVRMSALYASRRPHLATALRYGANRIVQSLE